MKSSNIVLVNFREILNTKLLTYNIKVSKRVSSLIRYMSNCPYPTAMGCVITNLVSCYRKESKLVFSRNTSYTVNKRTNSKGITPRQIIRCIDYLEVNGYCVEHRGRSHPDLESRFVSYILPTEAFIKKFCSNEEEVLLSEASYVMNYPTIELRDDSGKILSWQHTQLMQEAETVITQVNTVNEKAVIKDGDGNLLTNFYCRVFNNTLEHGGRWYRSDVLRMKHHYPDDEAKDQSRLDITIDGDKVVEIDYVSLHFRIVAAMRGMDMSRLPKDVYSSVLDDTPTAVDRLVIKQAVNILFNCNSRRQAEDTLKGQINKLSPEQKTDLSIGSAKLLIAGLLDKYQMFEEVLFKGDNFGMVLQNQDSWLAHRVLKQMVENNIPCLPVHDSFIVARQHEPILIKAMCNGFREMFGVEGSVPLRASHKDNGRVYKIEIYQ